ADAGERVWHGHVGHGRFRRFGVAAARFGRRVALARRRLEPLELRLDLAALLLLALDVDAPAGQLRREPDVLALLADGERQLLVLDDDFHHAVAVIDDRHALYLGGRERVGDERDRILRPLDDVDLLAAQLADDRLHARALHADARADRIHVALARVD